ncbi:MAG: glycosyltransferase family 4 protein [Bacteroidales bacterium]
MSRNNKKIVFLLHHNFPYGGASANLLRYFALGLANLNNEVEVILPGGNTYKERSERNKTKEGYIENVKYKHLCYLNHPDNILGKFVSKICQFLYPIVYFSKLKNKKEIDLLITYDVAFTRTLVALIIKLILRKKLIVIIPDFFKKPKRQSSLLKHLKWYDFFLGIRYIVKYADGFIVASNYLKKYIEETVKSQKKIYVFSTLVDPKKFECNNIVKFKENMNTIGYVGNLTFEDGLFDLIKSFTVLNSNYPDTHLLIIGDSTNGHSLIPDLKKYITELGIVNSVTFTGLVPSIEVPELLASCQILVLARKSGILAEAGFPTKLGEYLSCKKPIVVTKVGDIPLYFKNKEHLILVEPDNIDSIVDGLETLINNPEIWDKIVQKAYSWMDNNINYKKATINIDIFLKNFIN